MKTETKKGMTWWQWFFAIGFFPITLTLLVWQKKNWTTSKKLKVIAGSFVTVFVVAALHGLFFAPEPIQKNTTNTNVSKQSKPEELSAFSENDALQKVKNYEFESTLKGITGKRRLEVYFYELEKEAIASNGKWTTNPAVGIDNGFYVVYAHQAYGDRKNPKWLATPEKIEAVDEESRLITPDLAPDGYNQKDQLIYDSFNSKLSRLMDGMPSSTDAQMDAIYEEAYRSVATEFKVTVDEAKQAVQRAIKANSVL